MLDPNPIFDLICLSRSWHTMVGGKMVGGKMVGGSFLSAKTLFRKGLSTSVHNPFVPTRPRPAIREYIHYFQYRICLQEDLAVDVLTFVR